MREALDAAEPFAAVAERADALDAVGAVECGDEEVPCGPELIEVEKVR